MYLNTTNLIKLSQVLLITIVLLTTLMIPMLYAQSPSITSNNSQPTPQPTLSPKLYESLEQVYAPVQGVEVNITTKPSKSVLSSPSPPVNQQTESFKVYLNTTGLSEFPNFNKPLAPQSPPAIGISYEAIQSASRPYDPHIAVGMTDLVVVINGQWAAYDKANPGNQITNRTFLNWFSTTIAITDTDIFDPRVVYDHWQQRYIMIVTAVNDITQENYWLVSVSKQATVVGQWINYALIPSDDYSNPSDYWSDQPYIGLDGDHLFIASNMALFGGNFSEYAKIRVYRLTDLYNNTITQSVQLNKLYNDNNMIVFNVRPANRLDEKGAMYFINEGYQKLNLWRFSDLFLTNTLVSTDITVAEYSEPPDAEQPNTPTRLNTVDERIQDAHYRNGAIWATHHIAFDWEGGAQSAIRIYEVEEDGSALRNQITLASDSYDLYFPSIATDKHSNLLVSFCISSNENSVAELYPSIGYTGRRATDAADTIDPTVMIIKAGQTAYEQGNPSRWGDYSGTVVDPANQETLWMFNQYVITDKQSGTWIAATSYYFYKTYLPVIKK